MKSILCADRLEIYILNKQIEDAKQNLADTDVLRREQELKINKLVQEITKVEERHNSLLAEGRKCYNAILSGETTAKWKNIIFNLSLNIIKLLMKFIFMSSKKSIIVLLIRINSF